MKRRMSSPRTANHPTIFQIIHLTAEYKKIYNNNKKHGYRVRRVVFYISIRKF